MTTSTFTDTMADVLDQSHAAIADCFLKHVATGDTHWVNNAIFVSGFATAIEAVLAAQDSGFGDVLTEMLNGKYFDMRELTRSNHVSYTAIGAAFHKR